MSESKISLFCSFRLTACFSVFLGLAVLYMQRINMSLAILCMVNNTAIRVQNEMSYLATNRTIVNDRKLVSFNETLIDEAKCKLQSFDSGPKIEKDGPFIWDKQSQGLILSAFFYGYIVTQFPGGWLGYKFGGKTVFGFAIFFGSIFNLLLPIAARTSFYLLLACRFFTGFFHGPSFPALASFWTKWTPPNERSRMLGIAFSGIQIGNVIALPVTGFLCVDGFDGGWPSIFYIYGAIGLLWSISFLTLISDKPIDQKFMSERERKYIVASTAVSAYKPKTTPWRHIFFSKITLTLYFCCVCSNWGLYLYLTQMPSYMKEVLKFDIKTNGILSSLSYFFSFFMGLFSSFASDYLISKDIISKLNSRRLFTIICMYFPMAALIGLSFVTCSHPYLGVALLTFGYFSTGAAGSAGFFLNIYDSCGPYSGIAIGIMNMLGTIPGFVGPYLVSILTSNHKQEEWQIVLWITAVIYFIGGTAYMLFADVSVQHWALDKEKENFIENGKPENEQLLEKKPIYKK